MSGELADMDGDAAYELDHYDAIEDFADAVCRLCDGEGTSPLSDAVPCSRCRGTGKEPTPAPDPPVSEPNMWMMAGGEWRDLTAVFAAADRVPALEQALCDLDDLLQNLSYATVGWGVKNDITHIRGCRTRLNKFKRSR